MHHIFSDGRMGGKVIEMACEAALDPAGAFSPTLILTPRPIHHDIHSRPFCSLMNVIEHSANEKGLPFVRIALDRAELYEAPLWVFSSRQHEDYIEAVIEGIIQKSLILRCLPRVIVVDKRKRAQPVTDIFNQKMLKYA